MADRIVVVDDDELRGLIMRVAVTRTLYRKLAAYARDSQATGHSL